MPFTRAVLGVLLCSLRGASACGPGQYYYQDCRISTFCEIFGCWSMDCDDKCGTCPAGQFSPGGPACTQCAAGHFSQSGWGSCEQCPAGQTSNSGDTPCENRISRPLDRRRLGLLVDASETVSRRRRRLRRSHGLSTLLAGVYFELGSCVLGMSPWYNVKRPAHDVRDLRRRRVVAGRVILHEM